MLKEYIEDQTVVNELIYDNYKLFGLIQKGERTDGGGKYIDVPTGLAGGMGMGATFDAAYQNQSAGLDIEFQIPLQDYYYVGTVQGKTMRLSSNPKNAFKSALKWEMDKGMQEVGRRVAWQLYRTGTGTLASFTDITNGIITLTNPTDAIIFAKDMPLQAYTGDGSGTAQVALGYVIAVDADEGKLAVSATKGNATADTPSGWTTANPYLVNRGDFNLTPCGVLFWVPTANRPVLGTPQVRFGVDRAIDPQKLAGTFVDCAKKGLNIEESLIELVTRQSRFTGKSDVIFVNDVSYASLEKALQGRRVIDTIEGPTGVGYEGIKIFAGGQNPIVISDPFCPPKTAISLQLDTWKLISAGNKFPSTLPYPNGETFIIPPNLDAIQFRMGGHAALRCNAIGKNASCTLAE